MDPMLTVSEVARILNVTEEAVRRWLRDGDLDGTHIGSEWRVSQADLQEFINRNKGPRKRKNHEAE